MIRRIYSSLVPLLLSTSVLASSCGSSHNVAFPQSGISAASSKNPASPGSASSTTKRKTMIAIPACSAPIDLARWSTIQLAAQMLITSAVTNSLADANKAVASGVGGVVLMGNSATSTLRRDIAKMDSHAPFGIKPFVMTDEEGGGIQRMAQLVGSLPWPRNMTATMSPSQVESAAYKVGRGLIKLGINVDLAPVVDLDNRSGPSNSNPDGKRSFSIHPSTTTRYAKAFAIGLSRSGVLSTLKHFPGLGGASGNTDVMPARTLAFSQLMNSALIPFKALASSVPFIMISNASVPGASQGVPASLSPSVVSILRNMVGFKGIIISDSLETVSISSYQPDLSKAVVDSALAGVDMIMLASANPVQSPMFLQAENALSQAISSGVISRPIAEQRVGSILAMKGISASCIYY